MKKSLSLILSLLVCLFLSTCKKEEVIPPPTIVSFTPTGGAAGSIVTIVGTNFSTTPTGNTVTFAGTAAVVTASTTTTITTTVPAGALTGPIAVTVAGKAATSVTNFTTLLGTWTFTNGTATACTDPLDNGNYSCSTGCLTLTISATTITYSAPGLTSEVYNYSISGSTATFTDSTGGSGTVTFSIDGTILTITYPASSLSGCVYTEKHQKTS